MNFRTFKYWEYMDHATFETSFRIRFFKDNIPFFEEIANIHYCTENERIEIFNIMLDAHGQPPLTHDEIAWHKLTKDYQ